MATATGRTLQRHNLEADLDTDDKVRAKLEAAVAANALTRDGYADALAEMQTKIAGAEQKLAAEHSAVERKAASETLARDLDAIEQALPDYLAAGQRFADAFEKLHFHFESGAIARFIGNAAAQVDVAAGRARSHRERDPQRHCADPDAEAGARRSHCVRTRGHDPAAARLADHGQRSAISGD
ncbi:hypothetical protein QCM80_43305 [Bradyrhizobium sp. SSUT112]|nr:hypothetical protein [Bradyrhizobium sp. SSUT112]MDH2357339.1 hypothetical protein [Bradyrhizobium sp. SSUT112]